MSENPQVKAGATSTKSPLLQQLADRANPKKDEQLTPEQMLRLLSPQKINLECASLNMHTIKAAYETIDMMARSICNDRTDVEHLPEHSQEELRKLQQMHSILLNNMYAILAKKPETTEAKTAVEAEVEADEEQCEAEDIGHA